MASNGSSSIHAHHVTGCLPIDTGYITKFEPVIFYFSIGSIFAFLVIIGYFHSFVGEKTSGCPSPDKR